MSVIHQRRRDDREYLRELSRRIVGWDPIGLIALDAPSDEYECLIAPVVSGLREGLAPRQLAQVLRDRIVEHFGVEPSGIDRFAVEITEWHRAVR